MGVIKSRYLLDEQVFESKIGSGCINDAWNGGDLKSEINEKLRNINMMSPYTRVSMDIFLPVTEIDSSPSGTGVEHPRKMPLD